MSFDLVLFSGTGDRPGANDAGPVPGFRHGSLPEGGRIVGVARDDPDDARYRQLIASRFHEVEVPKRPNADEFEQFAGLPITCEWIFPARTTMSAHALPGGRNADTVVMYVATAPGLFTTVCEQLARLRVEYSPANSDRAGKAAGHDTVSNRAINETVRRGFAEQQVFRHRPLLGKPLGAEPVCHALWQCLVRNLWRRETIANIQITITEELGVEKRGALLRWHGALRHGAEPCPAAFAPLAWSRPSMPTLTPSATKNSGSALAEAGRPKP